MCIVSEVIKMTLISIRNLVKSYGRGEEKQTILKGLNIDFESNTFVSILGRSGSGKTTLLNTISTLDSFDSGQIYIDGFNISKLSKNTLNVLRNRYIGFVFQEFNLIEDLSILDNVALPLTINNYSLKEARKLAAFALKEVELHQFIKLKPNELSGGQKQRVAIARAIVNGQKIILCDEPTGALDDYTSENILNILKKLTKERTVIMVTHDEEYAKKFSDRIVVLSDGDVLYDSTDDFSSMDIEEENENKLNFKKQKFQFLNLLRLSFVSFKFNNKQLYKAMNTIINSAIIFLLATTIIYYINKYVGVYFINFTNSTVMNAFMQSLNKSNETLSVYMIYGIIYAYILFAMISFLFIYNMIIHEKRKDIAVMKAFGAGNLLISQLLVFKTFNYTLTLIKNMVIKIFIILLILNGFSALTYVIKADYGMFLSNIFQVIKDIFASLLKTEMPGSNTIGVNIWKLLITYGVIILVLVLESIISSIFMSRKNTIRVLARE